MDYESVGNNLLLPSVEILFKKLAPFGTAAVTVAGSVYKQKLPWVGSYTEERQSFRATLEVIVSDT